MIFENHLHLVQNESELILQINSHSNEIDVTNITS